MRAEALRRRKKTIRKRIKARQKEIEKLEALLVEISTPKPKPRTRADKMREIEVGGHRDFAVKNDTQAAAIRGSAYCIGRGLFRCERVAFATVRVHRL